MTSHLKAIGLMLITLSMIHVIFPSYFKWKTDLASLSLINRQVMKVHTFFIALTVLMMGVLCLFFSEELIATHLGKVICAGLGIFWTARLFIQIFVYSKELWRGKVFETMVHILFSLFWIYFGTIFLLIANS